MLDFTSALYLGLRHGSRTLAPWDQLTLGTPAALEELPEAIALGQRVAALVGGERAVLATSTLHAFWDVFGVMPEGAVAIFSDEGSYPIAQWALQQARARGVPARRFAHHDPDSLERALRSGPRGRTPVVVTDGFCPGCGQPAPLGEYLETTRTRGGLLVIDDSQAVGLFGAPARGAPYGTGGGGSTRWSAVAGPDVIWCASFAKAFGVPVAAVAGSAAWIARLEERGETRVHCSPPSVAHLTALRHALAVNARAGDALRRRVAERVVQFRCRLGALGLSATGGGFPVQRIVSPRGVRAAQLHERLLERGVKTVPQRSRCGPGTSVAFVLTARHRFEEIDAAVAALAGAIGEWTSEGAQLAR